jgi:hypothetical protein
MSQNPKENSRIGYIVYICHASTWSGLEIPRTVKSNVDTYQSVMYMQ